MDLLIINIYIYYFYINMSYWLAIYTYYLINKHSPESIDLLTFNSELAESLERNKE